MFITSRITQFYSFQTKNFLGSSPQTPHPLHRVITNTLYNSKNYYVICVSVLGKHQKGHISSEKAVSMAKLGFNHTNAE